MCRTSQRDRKRFVEVLTSLCGGESLVQILLKSDARSGLESVSFVNGPAQTIAQTIREGEIIPHLPNVLRIHVVLFRRETANDRCALLQRRTINIEVEVRCTATAGRA